MQDLSKVCSGEDYQNKWNSVLVEIDAPCGRRNLVAISRLLPVLPPGSDKGIAVHLPIDTLVAYAEILMENIPSSEYMLAGLACMYQYMGSMRSVMGILFFDLHRA